MPERELGERVRGLISEVRDWARARGGVGGRRSEVPRSGVSQHREREEERERESSRTGVMLKHGRLSKNRSAVEL